MSHCTSTSKLEHVSERATRLSKQADVRPNVRTWTSCMQLDLEFALSMIGFLGGLLSKERFASEMSAVTRVMMILQRDTGGESCAVHVPAPRRGRWIASWIAPWSRASRGCWGASAWPAKCLPSPSLLLSCNHFRVIAHAVIPLATTTSYYVRGNWY